jgi:hypothetical protein
VRPPDDHRRLPASAHIPATECRTREYFVDLATVSSTSLDDERDDVGATTAVGLSVYCASAFRFGPPRASAGPSAPRLVLETRTDRADRAEAADGSNSAARSCRVAVTLGEALKAARLIEHVVETVMFHP